MPAAPQIPPPTRLRRGRRWLLGTLAGTGVLLLASRLLLPWVPLPAGLSDPAVASPPLELLDRHGTPLRLLPAADGRVARELAEADVPEAMILATLAAEDARFRKHSGIDLLATVRAAGQWIRNRRVISGASTITQQLVKLAEPRPRPRTLRTKAIEAVVALRLESDWDKSRILRAYLARIDYGNRCAGLAEASRHYFGKPPRDLDLAEAAFLAGLPQAPSRLNPRRHFERARTRQQWILRRCHQLGWITADERERAATEPLRLAPADPPFLAPHFCELVLQDLPQPTPTGAWRTSLDLPLQRECEIILRRQLARLKHAGVQDGAVVVLDNRTGEIRALVGSPNWWQPESGQVNGAWARRSPGSALKPFAYLLALADGATAADILPDVPAEYATPTGLFRPANYDRHCRGPVSLREALASSLNLPAVRLLADHGGPSRLQATLQEFGLTTLDRPSTDYGLGLVLGDAEVRLLELANAYATLARLGLWLPVRTQPGPPTHAGRRVAPADDCWLIADILQDPLARAGAFGLATPLRTGFPLACKTGTSSGFRDNWAFGFSPEFTLGVWVGNFSGQPMHDVSGVSGAGPVLHDLAVHLHRTFGSSWYPQPSNCLTARVEPLLGRRVTADRPGRSEVFLAGRLPGWLTPEDLTADGRIRLSREYAEWAAGPDQRLGNRVLIGETTEPTPVRILNPLPGTLCLLDADRSEASQRLNLKASRAVRWRSPTLEIEQGATGASARLQPGRHRLEAVTAEGTSAVETWIEVRRR
jgi:penicillin-binding protein 1C